MSAEIVAAINALTAEVKLLREGYAGQARDFQREAIELASGLIEQGEPDQARAILDAALDTLNPRRFYGANPEAKT